MGQSLIRMRVWPGDLDLNLHMNNGRYLTLMDLGRYDLMARNGLWKLVQRQRWMPLVGEARVVFRRSLRLFQEFTIRTRVVAWDAKWFYLEQTFERNDDLVAIGRVKALFRSKGKNVAPERIVTELGHSEPSPPVPDEWDRRGAVKPDAA